MNLSFTINLPSWLDAVYHINANQQFPAPEEKMRFVIDLARRNIQEKTGGPFGAAIFNENTHSLVAPGINVVVSQQLSIAHAETIATILAQKKLGTFDLARDPKQKFSLYSSGQPCVMCFGVTWWSGITKLVSAARSEDIENITGFKEGPLPEGWIDLLKNREGLPDLEVVRDVLREEACEVLKMYATSGQPVYNAGSTRK